MSVSGGRDSVMQLTSFETTYLCSWLLLCLIAFILFIRRPASFSITHREYWCFLAVRWKLVSFFIAASGITVIAPYTGDPTWDYVDAIFMSVLTFLTAPWAVGILYLSAKERRFSKKTGVAFCLWMFSASWSYDLYLLMRDGVYPGTWLSNIFASSVLYCAAGLLWNLDWREGRGVTFSFLERNWFQKNPDTRFQKLFWIAFPFMLLAASAILWFVV